MSGLQILAFLSGLAGLGATIGATVSNEWKATSRASSVITATWILQGLWNNCAGNAIGAWHCRPHHTTLKLEGKLSSHRKLRLMVIHLSRYHRGLRTYLIPYASHGNNTKGQKQQILQHRRQVKGGSYAVI